MRALLAASLSTLALAACGGGDDDEPAPQRAAPAQAQTRVRGTLDLERQAAPPDAGTQAGHGGGGATATTRSSRFSFSGTTQPGEARVTVDGAEARVERRGGGVFSVSVRGLPRGATRLTVRAAASGLQPWAERVTITRR